MKDKTKELLLNIVLFAIFVILLCMVLNIVGNYGKQCDKVRNALFKTGYHLEYQNILLNESERVTYQEVFAYDNDPQCKQLEKEYLDTYENLDIKVKS